MSDLSRVREWVEALRSRDYEQGQHNLMVSDADGERYCCLGVGSVLMGANVQPGDGVYVERSKTWDNSLPPVEFLTWLGLLSEEEAERWATKRPVCDVQVDWTEFDVFDDDAPEEDAEDRFQIPVGNSAIVNVSGLNDGGFTFEQIADIIDYFGVTAPPAPLSLF